MDGLTIDIDALWQLAVVALMLVAGWVTLRLLFKLTVTLFRIGCIVIGLIVGIAFLATLFASL